MRRGPFTYATHLAGLAALNLRHEGRNETEQPRREVLLQLQLQCEQRDADGLEVEERVRAPSQGAREREVQASLWPTVVVVVVTRRRGEGNGELGAFECVVDLQRRVRWHIPQVSPPLSHPRRRRAAP